MSGRSLAIADPVEPVLTPSAFPLLAQLRTGTREAHAAMEANEALSCLLSSSLRQADYVYALRGLHALHAGIAARLGTFAVDLPAGCDFDAGRLALLDEDLAFFGARPARKLGMAHCIKDAASALGALYVLEGSALGARIIGKAVRTSLGVQPGKGASFFCGSTADGARTRWVAMSACINDAGADMDRAARLRAVRGANDAFRALENALHRVASAPTGAASAIIVQPAATGQAMN